MIPSIRIRPALLAMALLLGLQPLSGADQAGAQGLAMLLRELICGCPTCAGDEPAAPVGSSCCSEEPADPEDCGEGPCTCTHPDDVPHPAPVTLAVPGYGERPIAELVLDGCWASSQRLVGTAELSPSESGGSSPPPRTVVDGPSGAAHWQLISDGSPGLVALFCTALL